MTKLRQPLTSKEAAERLGMSLRTFLRRVEEGAITPTHKLPGTRGAFLFDADSIDRLKNEAA
jgi:excisionase family DNA binding protein